MKDTKELFTDYETLPTTVKYILDTFGDAESYKQAEELLDLLRPLGYTFSYGLDSQPHSLQKIVKPEDTTQNLLDEIVAVAVRALATYQKDEDYVGWDNIHENIKIYKNEAIADYMVFQYTYENDDEFEVGFRRATEPWQAEIAAPLNRLAWIELNILLSTIKNLY